MIIQAGFDFVILARPLIVPDGKLTPRLVLIALDAEMQLDSVEVIPTISPAPWPRSTMLS